jgi:transcriptional regulator with XRE-family HTH domain
MTTPDPSAQSAQGGDGEAREAALVETLIVERAVRQRLSGREVSRRAGIPSPANLSRWERRVAEPLLGAFIRWADALGFDVVLQKRDDA